jgi:hypothetical protein
MLHLVVSAVDTRQSHHIRGCIQKFLDWPPRARTENGTALSHYVQLYRYFVSQSSEFGRHNPLCCFSTSVYCCLFCYGLSPETLGYTLVFMLIVIKYINLFLISMLLVWIEYNTAFLKAVFPKWSLWEARSGTTRICPSLWTWLIVNFL